MSDKHSAFIKALAGDKKKSCVSEENSKIIFSKLCDVPLNSRAVPVFGHGGLPVSAPL